MPHEHTLFFSSWPPHEQYYFVISVLSATLKKKKNLKEIVSANSLQKKSTEYLAKNHFPFLS